VLNKGISDGKRDLGSDFKCGRLDDGYEQRDGPGAERHQPIADRIQTVIRGWIQQGLGGIGLS
jgi:hypothetical protein